MSIFTDVFFVAGSAPKWSPSLDFLHELCRYMELEEVFVIRGFRKTIDLLAEDEDADMIFSQYEIPVTEALALLRSWQERPGRKPMAYYLNFESSDWVMRLHRAVYYGIPDEIGGYFSPLGFVITWGPTIIPRRDDDAHKNQGIYHFTLSGGGNGNPYEIDEYLHRIRDIEPVRDLIRFMEEATGKTIELRISIT